MKKIISFVFRAFIVFLPLEIGIIGLGLVAICYNYEYNIIIEMGLIIFGLTIFIIGMFSWIIWLFVLLDDSEQKNLEKKERSIYDDLLYETYMVDMLYEDEELYHMLRSRRHYIY